MQSRRVAASGPFILNSLKYLCSSTYLVREQRLTNRSQIPPLFLQDCFSNTLVSTGRLDVVCLRVVMVIMKSIISSHVMQQVSGHLLLCSHLAACLELQVHSPRTAKSGKGWGRGRGGGAQATLLELHNIYIYIYNTLVSTILPTLT